jgi:hypothetical protein
MQMADFDDKFRYVLKCRLCYQQNRDLVVKFPFHRLRLKVVSIARAPRGFKELLNMFASCS